MAVASLARRIPSPPPRLPAFLKYLPGVKMNWTVGDLRSVTERDVFFPSQPFLNLLYGRNKFIPVVPKTAREVEHSSSATDVEKA